MKKIITILAIIVLSMSVFAGCGDSYRANQLKGTQDTSYAVTSNGGSAVQYGNYVYFVNGNRGYDDADGKQNLFGQVMKGGMYRAELNGTATDRVEIVDGQETTIKDKSGKAIKDFKSTVDAKTFIEFKSTVGKDYDDKDINIVDVQSFIPKTIGTSGYDKGGIFIFDNYVYYATPNNLKNKEGVVNSTLTDFFRTTLDGKKTERIHTTTKAGAASPYAFYNQGGKVYLVVFEDGKIFSIAMTANKVEKAVYIENVVSVLFPEKSTYYKDIATNGIEDYIYYTRAPKDNELRLGNVVEMVRPTLVNSEKILETGKSITLDAVRDGLLFYRQAAVGSTALNIHYDNLYQVLIGNDATYSAQKGAMSSTESGFPVGSYTSIYSFRPSVMSNIVYQLVTTASNAVLFENNANPKTIFEGKMDVKGIQADYVYFTSDDAKLYRTKLFEAYSSKSDDTKKQQMTKEDVLATSGFALDFVAGHVVYMSKVDEWASNYTFFKKAVTPYKDELETFVGERTKADTKPTVCDVEGCEEEYHDHTERDADAANA